jgi:uncharacterized membrane protein/1-acyl-sn-glycerol-3-phosphate acyltransferase
MVIYLLTGYIYLMRFVKILFACHLAALVCGLGALLRVPPATEQWDTTLGIVNIFPFVLRWAALLQILFGAATMLLFGLLCTGWRKTITFFATSMLISLSIELLDIDRGLPFTSSAATVSPGTRWVGFAHYTIPLTWFYMGFASYLLASKLATGFKLRRQALWSLILGSYFLVAWRVALSAALAGEQLHSQLWQEYGAYFGMPGRILPGWTLHSLILMSTNSLFWGADLDTRHLTIWIPFAVYMVNTGLIIILNVGAGLWFPLCLSVLLILLPGSLALLPREETRTSQPSTGRALLSQFIWLIIRIGSWLVARIAPDVRVEGLEHLPRTGPVLIAARHFHHFYDGYILLRAIPRRLHPIVALDWVRARSLRLLIEFACALADWPIVLRSEPLREHGGGGRWAFSPLEVRHYLRQVTLAAVRLLRSGEILVIFPEGYPNIDPHSTPKLDFDAFLPFRSGFARLAELAEKDVQTRVAIVPAGLSYTRERARRWSATLRFGQALFLSDFAGTEQLLRTVETRVRALSSTVPPAAIDMPEQMSSS